MSNSSYTSKLTSSQFQGAGSFGTLTGAKAEGFMSGMAVTPPVANPGEVWFLSSDPPLWVPCGLDDGSATITGGVGGWEPVARPHRRAFLEWQGVELETLAVPVLMDGLVENRSQEAKIDALMRIGSPGVDGGQPPVLTLVGMVPHRGQQWVIQSIDWGTAIYQNMVRVRQHAVVTLQRYEPGDAITRSGAKAAGKRKTARTATYTVHKGDTLSGIAKKKMGAKTASDVKQGVKLLMAANKLRDPNHLKVGQKLKIPSAPISNVTSGGFQP